jgi:hypothetical protein
MMAFTEVPSKPQFLDIFCGAIECVGHFFAFVSHFVFLKDVWIRTQRAAAASRRYQLSHPSS